MIFVKIKTVCELTGLTSRAIRVYIDEQLITPSFTENYLGRRSFDFSDEDVNMLKSIVVLRRNDFSIDEIRDIINNSENSIIIVQNVKNRIEKRSEEYKLRLQAFSYIVTNRAYTISELAYQLSQTQNETSAPIEHCKVNIVNVFKTILTFVVVWLPVAFCIFSFSLRINAYSFPKFNIKFVILSMLTLVPSGAIFIISKIKFDYQKILKRILIILCAISIPFSLIMPSGIVTRSETTDFKNYRDFDPDCLANRNVVFQELFPNWPHYFENVKNEDGHYETVYLDAKYYYQFYQGFDYTYDIYAEWPLEDNEFDIEVQRVKEVFAKSVTNKIYNYEFVEMDKGDFSCMILYRGNEPFQRATDSYEYLIFAYNEKNNIVRYIYCDSLENGADQPYYLQLEW